MLDRFSNRMNAKAAAVLLTLNTRLGDVLKLWLLLAGFAATARIIFSPFTMAIASLPTFTSYMLLLLAPFVSTLLALRWFRDGHLQPQPATRLARVGRWRAVARAEAASHELYGTSGIMVSLLVGMMLNVPFRAAEYIAAVPPVPVAAPAWFAALHVAMTFDVVLFGSLYMIAFVAALRGAPLFPRLLVAIWAADLATQLVIATMIAGVPGLPAGVAAALHDLLEGNCKKVLVSMALWLPYLLLSTRVNVTYRHRVPA